MECLCSHCCFQVVCGNGSCFFKAPFFNCCYKQSRNSFEYAEYSMKGMGTEMQVNYAIKFPRVMEQKRLVNLAYDSNCDFPSRLRRL
jgi:hypothetical protein